MQSFSLKSIANRPFPGDPGARPIAGDQVGDARLLRQRAGADHDFDQMEASALWEGAPVQGGASSTTPRALLPGSFACVRIIFVCSESGIENGRLVFVASSSPQSIGIDTRGSHVG